MREPFLRDCLHCKRMVQLSWDGARRYYRGSCACGASCTSDGPSSPRLHDPCPAHPGEFALDPSDENRSHACMADEMRCAYCGVRLAPYPCHACGKFMTARRMHEAAAGEIPHHCEECLP